MEDTPQARLKYFVNQRFTSIKEFCNIFGTSPQSLNKYINKGNSVYKNRETLEKLSALGLNIRWYLFNEGVMDNGKVKTYVSPLDVVSEPQAEYNAVDLTKMSYDEMRKYYKRFAKEKENIKKIEEIFKILNLEL